MDPLAPRTQLAAWSRRHPSGMLLFVQLASLGVYAGLDGKPHARAVFSAIALVVVPLAVFVVATGPGVTSIGIALAVPAVVLSFAGIAADAPVLLLIASALEASLYFYAAYGLIRYMLKDRSVTADDLFATGATFTLLAWGFAYLFVVCQAMSPGSFTGLIEPDRGRTFLELLSLSVSTLAGVGNGDVIPIGAVARVITMFEQLAGVGYIATVVSRLIGLGVTRP